MNLIGDERTTSIRYQRHLINNVTITGNNFQNWKLVNAPRFDLDFYLDFPEHKIDIWYG
jgi:hypothetical protein